MPRLFIGLELPAAQAQALLALAEPGPGLRWQSAAQLHLTVRFIGELGEEQAEHLAAALSAMQAPAFELQIGGVGYFGSPQRPRILWAGVVAPAPLQALRELDGMETVPVIFMTARLQKSEIEEYQALGALGVIPKPFDPMNLSEQIAQILADAVGRDFR